MAISQPTFKPGQITVIGGATTQLITNLALTLSGTEYSLALQSGLRQLIVRARGNSRLQISFISGDTNLVFFTVPKGTSFILDDINFTGATIYIRSNLAGDTAEIIELF